MLGVGFTCAIFFFMHQVAQVNLSNSPLFPKPDFPNPTQV